jgi:gamma-glutamylcyclotransferase
MSSSSKTLYFAYGSNLWLHQMSTRCPSSAYLGIARLPNYRWIINDRGYANVVVVSSSTSSSSTPTKSEPKSKYSDVVYGLVFSLTPPDESRLDRNEGVRKKTPIVRYNLTPY